MDEINSRILHEIQGLSAGYYNVHRKKGAKQVKVPDQLEPKYIKKAKEDYRDSESKKKKDEIDENTIAFWHNRIKKANNKPVQQADN